MPGAGLTGDLLKRWRLARGWETRDLATAFHEACEKPLPQVEHLMKNITKWEAGVREPSEQYVLLYHRVFPGFGEVEPPAGIAVFGGPGQPAQPPSVLLARVSEVPPPDEASRIAATAIACGADPARTWALQEKYRDLYRMAADTAAILAALTGEAGDEPGRQAG